MTLRLQPAISIKMHQVAKCRLTFAWCLILFSKRVAKPVCISLKGNKGRNQLRGATPIFGHFPNSSHCGCQIGLRQHGCSITLPRLALEKAQMLIIGLDADTTVDLTILGACHLRCTQSTLPTLPSLLFGSIRDVTSLCRV